MAEGCLMCREVSAGYLVGAGPHQLLRPHRPGHRRQTGRHSAAGRGPPPNSRPVLVRLSRQLRDGPPEPGRGAGPSDRHPIADDKRHRRTKRGDDDDNNNGGGISDNDAGLARGEKGETYRRRRYSSAGPRRQILPAHQLGRIHHSLSWILK